MKSKINIIAEIGVNHNGKFLTAIKLMQKAKKCGADSVKFQTFFTDEFCKEDTKKAFYQIKQTPKKLSHYNMLKNLELKEYEFFKLYNFAQKLKLNFISTPYDIKSVRLLRKLNINCFKTASTDLVDLLLHKEIIKTRKPVIISTGASTISEIKKTINFYKKNKHNKISLLHCVSNYPCSDESLNLNVISTLRNTFKLPVGFSDHSSNSKAATLAVALGAKIIEKHFTLDKTMSGPDHYSSADPKTFKKYVHLLRETEKLLGTFVKIIQPEEKSIRRISRKSITAKSNISKNTRIRSKDITMKRPGTGLNGHQLSRVLGKRLKFNIKKNYQIKIEDLKR